MAVAGHAHAMRGDVRSAARRLQRRRTEMRGDAVRRAERTESLEEYTMKQQMKPHCERINALMKKKKLRRGESNSRFYDVTS